MPSSKQGKKSERDGGLLSGRQRRKNMSVMLVDEW